MIETATLEASATANSAVTKPAPKPRAKRSVLKRKVKKVASGNGHINDGCEDVAKAIGYDLTTVQVRILRSLKTKRSPVGRKVLKEDCNHRPGKPALLVWTKQLRALSPKLVKVEVDEEKVGKLLYSITAKGKDTLAGAEKAAAVAAREKAKAN